MKNKCKLSSLIHSSWNINIIFVYYHNINLQISSSYRICVINDMISSVPPSPIILFSDNRNGSISSIEENEEAENHVFSEAAPTDSVRRVHHEADEPFVIELRPSESVEKLIVNQIHSQNLTSLFTFMRSNKNNPILAAGEKVIQTMEKKFDEKMNSSIIQSLASEFPLESCCCRAELPGYCTFCQKHLSACHMYVSTQGKCQIVSHEEATNRRLLERAKESSKRILSLAGKSIDVFPTFTYTCYEAEICEECSNALRHYRWKKEYEKDNQLAEKMTVVEMYNQLYSQWSLLKYFCEKHLTICRKMKRSRCEKVITSFTESNKNFRKQLSMVRKESDQMDYYGQSTANSCLGSLQLEIAHFTHRSCSLMQEKVSTANEDLKQFLEMERKVMAKEPPALSEIDLNSTKKLIPLPLPFLPPIKKKSGANGGGPIGWIGSLFW